MAGHYFGSLMNEQLKKLDEIHLKFADKPETAIPQEMPKKEPDHPLFKLKIREKPQWLRHKDFQKSELNHRKRTLQYLAKDTRDEISLDIAYKIHTCKKSAPCKSMFCPYCRDEVQTNAVIKAKQIFANTPADQLAFLTLLLPVTYLPERDAKELIDDRRSKNRDMFNYHNFTDVKLFDAFEIDVKNWKDAMRQPFISPK
jgi:hypothetical protein